MIGDDTQDGILAIDGPAGAGKSSVARRVAAALGFAYLDTGAMYRGVTLHCLRAGLGEVPLEEDAVAAVLPSLDLRIDAAGRVLLDGAPVEAPLRSPAVTARVSAVSAVPAVRAAMVRLQREAAARLQERWAGVVVDGRDIGSHVFPRARHRFYLDATVEERARRRRLQEGGQGSLAEWIECIRERDRKDSGRTLAPLCIPDGATVVDTTDLAEDEVVDLIVEAVRA